MPMPTSMQRPRQSVTGKASGAGATRSNLGISGSNGGITNSSIRRVLLRRCRLWHRDGAGPRRCPCTGHSQGSAPQGRLCQQHSLKAPGRCVRPCFRIVWTAITNKAGFGVNAIRGLFIPNSSESNRETFAGQAALVGNAALPGRCGEYLKYVISMHQSSRGVSFY